MKLIRFGSPGTETPGLQLEDGSRIDASGFGMDWNRDFFADPANLALAHPAYWAGFAVIGEGGVAGR